MFKKVHKNLVAVMILAGALTGDPGTGFAAGAPLMQEQAITATPYDGRLDQAGALLEYLPAKNARSAEDLFNNARAFRYKEDVRGRDHWQTPEETERRFAGDCEDKAVWLYANLKINGHKGVRLVVGRKDGASRGFHVWVMMEASGGGFFVLDPSAQKRIWNASDFTGGEYKPLYSFDGIHRYRHGS